MRRQPVTGTIRLSVSTPAMNQPLEKHTPMMQQYLRIKA